MLRPVTGSTPSPFDGGRVRLPGAAGRVRLAALGLPAVVLILGAGIPGGRRRSRAAHASAAAVPLVALGLRRLARRRVAAGEADVASVIPITVLIPARDEAPVIGALVGDLAAARRDGLSVVVVDDASSDGTGRAARDAITRAGLADVALVVTLATPSGSKAAALAAVPVPDAGAVVVLDADARVAPDFVDQVRLAATRSSVAQARRRMLRPTAIAGLGGFGPVENGSGAGPRAGLLVRLLTLAQDGEQAVDDRIGRARLALRGAAELRGDGMVLTAEALARLGGWPSGALCEDLELSTTWYLQTGRGAQRPPGLVVWEQPVLDPRVLLAQRLRWAEGSVRRDLRIGLPAVLDASVPAWRRADVAVYASQALVPWMAAGLAARAAATGDRGVRRRAATSVALLAGGYGLGALVLAWAAEADHAPSVRHRSSLDRLGRAGVVALFTGLWPLVLPAAWLRVARRPGGSRFAQTPHAPAAAFAVPRRGLDAAAGDDARPIPTDLPAGDQRAGTTPAASERATLCQPPPRWSRSSATTAVVSAVQPGTAR
jgi:hypothetical protein